MRLNIVVVGTGYVGLVTGTCFAEMGNNVTCIDTNSKIIDDLNNGKVHIFEENLENLVKSNIAANRLHFKTRMDYSVSNAEIVFIAVGTPERDDGSANTDFVYKVAMDIGKNIENYTCIVVKSTVPIGTTEEVGKIIQNNIKNPESTFNIVSNPEFLKEGVAVSDFMKPDRIIVGAVNEKALSIMRVLYSPFNRTHNKILEMGIRDAELTKYASNCMLATKISFINEVSNIAEVFGANIENIRLGIGSDSRIGYHFIYPGCGYGGSCFPKDVSALIKIAEQNDIDPVLLKSVEQRNFIQKQILFKKFTSYYSRNVSDKAVTLWGISFKPGTDDIRDASSIALLEELIQHNIRINVHDPVALENLKNYINEKHPNFDNIEYFDDQYESLINSDCLFLVTEWKNYRQPDFERIYKNMNVPLIIDGRNVYINDLIVRDKFYYYCVGQ